MAATQRRSWTPAVREFVQEVETQMAATGVNVAKLAELTGLSRQYIYRILNGTCVPTLKVAENIAKHLGLKIETVRA